MEDMTEDGAENKTKGVLQGAKEKLFGSKTMKDSDEATATKGDSTARRAAAALRPERRSSSAFVSRAASSRGGSRRAVAPVEDAAKS